MAAVLWMGGGVTAHADMIGMPEADRQAVIRALQAAKQQRWSYAEAQIAGTKDPLAARIYYWMYYTNASGPFNFGRISSFADQVSDWPKSRALRLAVERSIRDDTSSRDVTEWFRKHTPLTVDGMMAYLSALRAQGNTQAIGAALNGWWGDAQLTNDQQNRVLSSYGKLISTDAHKRRFNTTLHRNQQSNARALARVLGQGYPELAEARIRLAAGEAGVDSFISRVPAHLQNDPGLQLERLRWRRKKDMDFRAIEILHNAPPSELIANPEDWWRERHILSRRMIEKKQYKSAYLLVSKHGLSQGEPFAQAEFLSGWLALRFLNEPGKAFLHFEKLYNNSSMPITKGRAAYWAGRASEALKAENVATQWYTVSASYGATFYGQLSLARLGRDAEPVSVMPPLPAKARVSFEADPKIQAANVMFKAGLQDEGDSFLRSYADRATLREQFYLAAEMADRMQRPNDSVAIARRAQTQGITMIEYAFPTILAQMKNANAEWALVHAIIRQESAFDSKAVSSAGARGLMQLMPATAKETASKAGLAHQTDWLTARPAHNIQLGSLYINQMLSRFDYNYAMAAAAYNAGPGRVNQWVRQIGDPRTGDVDLIDWIELIPVSETRNYVQRVLEGVYVYRNKFKDVQKGQLRPIHTSYRTGS